MPTYTVSAWVLEHKADMVYVGMSGALSHEIKGEPQSGDGCTADAFMNVRAELLLFKYKISLLRFYMTGEGLFFILFILRLDAHTGHSQS